MMNEIKVYVVDLSTVKKKRKFLYFQWVDPKTGKRRTQSSKCTNRRDANRAAPAFEKVLKSRVPSRDGKFSWDDFVAAYKTDHLATLKVKSAKRSMSVLTVFGQLMRPGKVGNVTTSMMTEYATKLREGTDTSVARKEATIIAHIQKLRTALNWAAANGHIDEPPKPPSVKTIKPRAKGRPLSGREFVAMLRATSAVVGIDGAKSWRRLLIGLWLSGLRLDEALSLVWGNGERYESSIWIDTTHEYPLFGIIAESEKGNTDRLLPLTPDFGKWILKHTPEIDRDGYVFSLAKSRHKDARNMDYASKIICKIGSVAGVKVNASGKFASAHDLRRSFGLRWAYQVFPAELQQLMRHADISTTMKYYALMEARGFAERLWNKKPKGD